jgi:hypothetical protein
MSATAGRQSFKTGWHGWEVTVALLDDFPIVHSPSTHGPCHTLDRLKVIFGKPPPGWKVMVMKWR